MPDRTSQRFVINNPAGSHAKVTPRRHWRVRRLPYIEFVCVDPPLEPAGGAR